MLRLPTRVFQDLTKSEISKSALLRFLPALVFQEFENSLKCFGQTDFFTSLEIAKFLEAISSSKVIGPSSEN